MATALAVSAFFAGVLVGWLITSTNRFRFSETVDAGDVINALATLAVAVFIQVLYKRLYSGRRADTDLLLEHCRGVSTAFRELQRHAAACRDSKKLSKAERESLVAAERELSNSIHSLQVALDTCGRRVTKIKLDDLKSKRECLKAALTDTPFPGPYSGSAQAEINRAFKETRDEITRIFFAINRS